MNAFLRTASLAGTALLMMTAGAGCRSTGRPPAQHHLHPHRRPGLRRPVVPRQPDPQDAEHRPAARRRRCASRFPRQPDLLAHARALITGRHEFRNGVTHTIFERERLTLKAMTLAQVLKSAGYTTGIFGKWHLGDEDALPARPARLRRSVHPRRRRHRPDLSRQLRRRAGQHLFQPGDPAQRQVREDQGLLHGRVLRARR